MLDKIMNTLDEYNHTYDRNEVKALLSRWEKAKAPLISVLSNHPNYDPDIYAVVMPVRETRDNEDRYSSFYNLKDYVKSQMQVPAEEAKVLAEIGYWSLSQFLDDEVLQCIKNVSDAYDFRSGQKTSRAVNQVLSKIGATQLSDYNRLFAIFADSVNPLKIDRRAVLSVNPLDYLLMSSGGASWKSCHNITDGCYMAGTLSYLGDGSSMIFYTIDNEAEGYIPYLPKITREVFCYHEGKLLQSRCYPSNAEEIKQNYRQVVQSVFADALGYPNLWKLEKDQDKVNEHVRTHRHAIHYEDYIYSEYRANISLLKDYPLTDEKILVGSECHCLDCGSLLEDTDSLSCCEGKYYCADCGNRIESGYEIWVDGEVYCEDCVSYCNRCEEYFRGELTSVRDRNELVCPDCLEDYYTYVDCCDEYVPNDEAYYIACEDRYVCAGCMDNYFYCASCGEYFPVDELHELDGEYYCEECFDGIVPEKEVG